VHGEGGGGGGFAVEVAGGGEVVEGGFEGYFVVGSVGGRVSNCLGKVKLSEGNAYAS